jgi:ABC-type multidrug transport system ATPase subunit
MNGLGLHLDSVSVCFGQKEALRDITLDCPAGTVTCLIGPNGAGKSTLLALAAGLLPSSAGRIEIGNQGRTAFNERPPVAYLPQESRFPDVLTVREVFEFACAARGADATARRGTVETSGIDVVLDRPVCELSGGWVRRLGLAVALLAPAAFVLLDEPFVGLDPETLERVLAHLDRRRAAGGTVVLASHEFEIIDLLPRRIAVLDEGRLRGVFPASARSSRLLYRQVLAPSAVECRYAG